MRSTLLALSLALTMTGGAFAQTEDDEHAAHHPKPSASESAEQKERPATPRAGGADLKSVEDLMSRIQQTGDSAQRAELLRQHALALREQVRAMRAASRKRMAMMGGGAQPGSAGDDPHAAHKAAAGDDAASSARASAASADDPHAAHKGDSRDTSQGDKAGKKGMMGGGMMKMHESIERRLDGIERVLEQLIEREVVESGAR